MKSRPTATTETPNLALCGIKTLYLSTIYSYNIITLLSNRLTLVINWPEIIMLPTISSSRQSLLDHYRPWLVTASNSWTIPNWTYSAPTQGHAYHSSVTLISHLNYFANLKFNIVMRKRIPIVFLFMSFSESLA